MKNKNVVKRWKKISGQNKMRKTFKSKKKNTVKFRPSTSNEFRKIVINAIKLTLVTSRL